MAEKPKKRSGDKKKPKITMETPVPDMPANVIEFPNQVELE